MLLLKIVEKIIDSTAIDNSGFNTLQIIPSELLAYFRLISLVTNSLITNAYCFFRSDLNKFILISSFF